MSEMVERVARALSASDPDFESYDKIARRVIEAMRELTPEMADAANGPWCDDDRPSFEQEWRMVIDAMLQTPRGQA